MDLDSQSCPHCGAHIAQNMQNHRYQYVPQEVSDVSDALPRALASSSRTARIFSIVSLAAGGILGIVMGAMANKKLNVIENALAELSEKDEKTRSMAYWGIRLSSLRLVLSIILLFVVCSV